MSDRCVVSHRTAADDRFPVHVRQHRPGAVLITSTSSSRSGPHPHTTPDGSREWSTAVWTGLDVVVSSARSHFGLVARTGDQMQPSCWEAVAQLLAVEELRPAFAVTEPAEPLPRAQIQHDKHMAYAAGAGANRPAEPTPHSARGIVPTIQCHRAPVWYSSTYTGSGSAG